MTETESRDPDRMLAELWAQDEPPARDAVFVLAAMERVERLRLIEGVLSLIGPAIAASMLLWALAPVISTLAASLRPDPAVIGPLAGAAVMAMFLWSWASDRLQPLEV
jgi:hypothetical protein